MISLNVKFITKLSRRSGWGGGGRVEDVKTAYPATSSEVFEMSVDKCGFVLLIFAIGIVEIYLYL